MFKIHIIDLIDFSSAKGVIKHFVNSISGKDSVSVYKFLGTSRFDSESNWNVTWRGKNNVVMRVKCQHPFLVWLNVSNGEFSMQYWDQLLNYSR